MKKVLILCSVGLFISTYSLNAQTIVLINGTPTEVILDKTEIVSTMSTNLEDHLEDYDTSVVPFVETRMLAIESKETEAPTIAAVKQNGSDRLKSSTEE